MEHEKFRSFDQFWPHYVAEHSKPATRALHAAGTLAGLALIAAGAWTGRWWLALSALPIGYGAAWVGHFFVEHNRPATFRYPLWSFLADYKMIALMLAGRMEKEIERARARRA